MSEKTVEKSGSFPILGIMILMLFAGKVFEITPTLAAMSWWWVFAPLWIPLGLIIVGLALYFGGAILYFGFKDGWTKKQRFAKMQKRINARNGR